MPPQDYRGFIDEVNELVARDFWGEYVPNEKHRRNTVAIHTNQSIGVSQVRSGVRLGHGRLASTGPNGEKRPFEKITKLKPWPPAFGRSTYRKQAYHCCDPHLATDLSLSG